MAATFLMPINYSHCIIFKLAVSHDLSLNASYICIVSADTEAFTVSNALSK